MTSVRLLINSRFFLEIDLNDLSILFACLNEMAYGFKEEIRIRNSLKLEEVEILLEKTRTIISTLEIFHISSSALSSEQSDSQFESEHNISISENELKILRVSLFEVINIIGKRSLARTGYNLSLVNTLSEKFKTDSTAGLEASLE